MSEEFDDARDCHDSYYAAIAEIGRRVKAGEEPIPTTGYFGPRERGRIAQEVKYIIPNNWQPIGRIVVRIVGGLEVGIPPAAGRA